MALTIRGLGTAVPVTATTQAEAVGLARVLCATTAEQGSWLGLVYAGSGVERRHVALPRQVVDDILSGSRESESVFLPSGATGDTGPTTGQRIAAYAALAGPLALAAARRAMADGATAAGDVTHVVTVSCTGFAAPGVDLALIEGLGLRPTVERTHVGFMGCHGAINGLRVASAYAGADPAAVVLLCAVELCSLHYHYGWDPQKLIANALFADGAAAVVGAASGPAGAWRVRATGSCLIPDSRDAMGWVVGDRGFEMTLSRRVPGLIANHLRPWLEGWLSRCGFRLGDVGSWAIHPGGPRILDAVETALALPRGAADDARAVLATHGNMSSPTVLFVLERLRRRGAARPCVALAFGPGLVAEAALLE